MDSEKDVKLEREEETYLPIQMYVCINKQYVLGVERQRDVRETKYYCSNVQCTQVWYYFNVGEE